MPKNYTIEARGPMAEIQLFGDIGPGGVTAAQFAKDLKLLGGNVREIEVVLSSGGGSAVDALGIAGALQAHKASVTIAIQGAALSAASAIAMSADRLTMSESSVFMMHLPYVSGAGGTAEDLRSTAEAIDRMAVSLVTTYRRRFKMTDDEITALLKAETWYSAQELKDLGVVDEITEGGEEEMAIAASFDPTRFSNAPDHIKARIEEMTTKTDPTKIENKAEILAAEKSRRESIRAAFSRYAEDHPRLLNACLDDPTIDVQAASAKLLDAVGRGRGPLGAGNRHTITTGGDDLQEFRNAAIDCLAMRHGIEIDKPHPGAQDLQRMSVVNMAEVCLKRATGRSTASMSNSQIVAAAITHSSSDFPQLLSNLAGKSLQAGYMAEPASFKQWVHEVEVNDFKTNSRPQLSETPALKKVLENGEFTYGSMTEAEENYVLETFGRIFSISRQALINDDLGAWTRNAQAFGQSATRRMGDNVYSVLTDNANMSDGSALFSAAHGNLASTGTALSVASLGGARAAMALQKGSAGLQTLNLMAKYLIVPVSIQTEAEQLLATLVDPSKQNDTTNPAWIRGLELVTDARLDANSVTGWYLACDYNQLDTVESATLAGGGVSYTEKEGFEVDGLSVKMRLDHAAKAIEWKGMYYNPGV